MVCPQVPAGVLADRVGGPPVMLASLAAWSAVMGATPLVRLLPGRSLFAGLLLARAALGLAQSAIMPATSAMAARSAPSGKCNVHDSYACHLC